LLFPYIGMKSFCKPSVVPVDFFFKNRGFIY